MIFCVTVDTEGDNQWDHGAPLLTENVRFWQPFQTICERHGVVPTYLITSEIAADPLAQRLLSSWSAEGTAEVGAHLHPWTTPPFVDAAGLRFNDWAHAFICQLPDELISEKLDNLVSEIEQKVGVRPVSFRAGRFGFDIRVARELSRLGFTVDSSVTPLVEWSRHAGLPGRGGGPDFRRHGLRPFVLQGSGDPGLLEVPVTIVPTLSLLRRYPRLLDAFMTLPVRAARKLLFRQWLCPQPVWLRPTPEFRRDDLENAWMVAEQSGAPVAVMMFHSSELMPGCSPYRPTTESIYELLGLLDDFFRFAVDAGASPASLKDAAAAVRRTTKVEEKPL
jgi:hypothetical protein